MEDFITKREHDEFTRRMDAENERQNKRIALLEETVRQINDLTVSVREMAVNMGNMLEEQKKQGERLGKLEREPVETNKQIRQAIITTIVGTAAGAVVTAVLMLL